MLRWAAFANCPSGDSLLSGTRIDSGYSWFREQLVAKTQPKEQTWQCLAKSKNLASIETLTAGMASLDEAERLRCVAVLLTRPENAAQEAVVRNWNGITDAAIEVPSSEAPRLAKVVSRMLSEGSAAEQDLALQVATQVGLTETLKQIVGFAITTDHPLREKSVRCMLEMCRRWGKKARSSKDVPRVRSQMLDAIGYQIELFDEHRCGDVVDAWLALAHWEDSQHRRLISNPTHPAYRQLITRLKSSNAPEVIELLAGYITRCRSAPAAVVETLVARRDIELAIAMAECLDDQSMVTALNNLRRLKPLACFDEIEEKLTTVGPDLQRKLWLMASASSRQLELILRGALQLADSKDGDSLTVASAMIRGCRRPDCETLSSAIEESMSEPTNEGSLGHRLIELSQWLTCDSVQLRATAKQFFREFTIEGLTEAVRMWPTSLCRAMAGIVRKLVTEYDEILTRQLQSPAPNRRAAALQVVGLMD
ncbi:MAG TPA: hypothetical protein DDW52_05940, partial [Planctomycetaceae bacterium]|nr:hypothetical protein [Planctomycetaceae bacterium]